MNILYRFFLLFAGTLCLGLSSCKDETQIEKDTQEKGTYFSIKQYILDEWDTHMGEPIVFTKTVKENGKTDSSMTNVEIMNWPEILGPFIASDISDKKFLGKYAFSQFDDELDNTHNLMYVANGDEMFVQKLLITLDATTVKVKGIYIETHKKVLWSTTTQKLFYSPVRTIQVQEYSKPLIGTKKEKVTQYQVVR